MKKITCRRCGRKVRRREAVGEFCSLDCWTHDLVDKAGEVLTSLERLNDRLDDQLLSELSQKADGAIREKKCHFVRSYKTH